MSNEPLSTEQLAAIDRARIIHPYLGDSVTERVIMVKGKGSLLWDSEGNEYLDATGGLWLAQIGHGREELAEVAAEQLKQLEFFMSFWEFSNDKAIRLAERLVSLAPEGIEKAYFTSGGSEGNEAAIKMARYYHHRKGDSDRTWIIGRHKAYHGVGFGGGSVTGFPVYHDGFGPMMPNVAHLTPPWPFRSELFGDSRKELTPTQVTDFCIRELEQTIERIGAGNIAAFLGEPIMGVAGMVVPPADYWPRVAEVCRANGILLILDEVVTAYGRVGHWFAAQHFGITPDIIVTAKGITSGYLPLGAVLVAGHVAAELERDHGFPMGYTYNGHPTACAVALANLDIIEREGLLEKAVKTGDFLAAQLRAQLADIPWLGEVRNVGMMLAVELVDDQTLRTPLPNTQGIADAVRRDHGVIVRDSSHGLVLSPNLNFTEDEAIRVAEAIRAVLLRTSADGSIA